VSREGVPLAKKSGLGLRCGAIRVASRGKFNGKDFEKVLGQNLLGSHPARSESRKKRVGGDFSARVPCPYDSRMELADESCGVETTLTL
jgi:hypothetical protein